MTGQEIATNESASSGASIAIRELTDPQKQLIKNTIAKGATDLELELFFYQCNRTQLDPFAKQIYCVPRYNAKERRYDYTTQVSIDGARLVAQRSNNYAGQTDVEYYSEKTGEWTDVWLPSMGDNPDAARVGVYRHGFAAPLYATATWDQYSVWLPRIPPKDGKPEVPRRLSPFWAKMPALMLGKCAEMLALRKAFPMELSGLYLIEEMGYDEAPAPVEKKRRRANAAKVAPAGTTRTRGAPVATSEPVDVEPDETYEPEEDREIASQTEHDSLSALMSQMEESESENLAGIWRAANYPPLSHGLTLPEIQRITAWVLDILGEDAPRTSQDASNAAGGGIIDAEVVEPTGDESASNPAPLMHRGREVEPFTEADESEELRNRRLGVGGGFSRGTSAKPTTAITKTSIGTIFGKLRRLGVTPEKVNIDGVEIDDTTMLHDYVAEILGKPVTSFTDLTKSDGAKIILALDDRLSNAE